METRLADVRRILNAAVGIRIPNHSGTGKFWDLPRDRFVATIVRGLPVIVPGDPAASGLVKAIRGTVPFDGSRFIRMPENGPYVVEDDIVLIEGWIRDGAPDVDSRSRPPRLAELTAELATAGPGRDGNECLKKSVREAIELEFATVPPYLTAAWSIKTPGSAVAATLLDVAIEEMNHMGLACNMLAGLGESPALATADLVPIFPGHLPGEVNPLLEVTLRRLTPEQVKVFMDIEYPEGGPITLRGLDTIGAFYAELSDAFVRVNPSLDTTCQRGEGQLKKLATVGDVVAAIDLIRRQGEGSKHDQSPNGPDGFLAHYYQFRGIYVGAKYVQDPVTKVWAHNGPPIPLPEVYPMADIPEYGYLQADVPDASVWGKIADFDLTFSTMLRQLDTVWRVPTASMNDPVRTMRSLGPKAIALISDERHQRPDGRGTYGPCFRFV